MKISKKHQPDYLKSFSRDKKLIALVKSSETKEMLFESKTWLEKLCEQLKAQ